jgi:hypothetical protein
MEPDAALKLVSGGGFIGVGNGRRIRKVKPEGVKAAWQRGAIPAIRSDIAAVMTAFPRLPHVQKNPQAAGGKEWT